MEVVMSTTIYTRADKLNTAPSACGHEAGLDEDTLCRYACQHQGSTGRLAEPSFQRGACPGCYFQCFQIGTSQTVAIMPDMSSGRAWTVNGQQQVVVMHLRIPCRFEHPYKKCTTSRRMAKLLVRPGMVSKVAGEPHRARVRTSHPLEGGHGRAVPGRPCLTWRGHRHSLPTPPSSAPPRQLHTTQHRSCHHQTSPRPHNLGTFCASTACHHRSLINCLDRSTPHLGLPSFCCHFGLISASKHARPRHGDGRARLPGRRRARAQDLCPPDSQR